MTLIQKYFPPEEIAEAKKVTFLRLAQVTVTGAIRRRPAATSDEQSLTPPPCPRSHLLCRDWIGALVTLSHHLWWGGGKKPEKIVFFSNSYRWASSQQEATSLARNFWGQQHKFFSFWLISFLSGLSLALNKEGCDWQDRHSSRANSGRATHLSQTRYTPLVEVNQAIKAWSYILSSVKRWTTRF